MKVNSSNIKEVEWKETKGGEGTLEVTFKTGDVYRYYEVPQGIYNKLIAAPSIGSFFHQFIKEAGYQYEKVISNEESVQDKLDSALNWIRTVSDELVMAGFPSGDRTVQLQNIRELIKRVTN